MSSHHHILRVVSLEMQHALLEVGFEVSLAKTTLVTFNKGVQAERDTAARLSIAIEQGVTSLLGSCL